MQKLINVLALSSFVVSAAVVGGGTWLYLNKDVMLEEARENVANAAVDAVSGALPGLLDAAIPDVPEVTSPNIPLGETGPNIRLP